jgi:benzoyl-CoA 2,3-dioxygenase component B
MDLFGSEQSTNVAAYYTGGLKGRWQETRRKDDHELKDATYRTRVVRDGRIVDEEVPYLTALNLDLRDEYVADCENGVKRWNQALEDAGCELRLSLPHEGFNRRVGNFAEHFVSPTGEVLTEQQWEAAVGNWLPSAKDREKVAALMVAHYEPGEFAGWIAAPKTGINDQPVEFDYVHLREEALA